jgi:hypothetical protein
VVLNHFRNFETIEVLLSHLQKYSLQCFLDIVGRERTENSCLDFLSHEKEAPAGGMDLELTADAIRYALEKSRLRRFQQGI